MSDPVEHHYVPVFLLRRWAGPDGKVIRYYRPRDVVVTRAVAPRSAAKLAHLYALEHLLAKDRNIVEREFMGPVVDEPAAAAHRVFLSRPGGHLDAQLRIGWARFLVSLRYRTPAAVEDMRAEGERTLREALAANPEEYEAARAPEHPATFVEFVETYLPAAFKSIGNLVLPSIIQSEQICRSILSMNWWVVHTPRDELDLLLGDEPIFFSHGLADQRCAVVLPIAPRSVFLAAYDPLKRDALFGRTPNVVIRAFNETTVALARQDVFGASRHHLRFVERRLRHRPCVL
jgi:hypothetical protein